MKLFRVRATRAIQGSGPGTRILTVEIPVGTGTIFASKPPDAADPESKVHDRNFLCDELSESDARDHIARGGGVTVVDMPLSALVQFVNDLNGDPEESEPAPTPAAKRRKTPARK